MKEQKQKKNKKFEVKISDTHPSLPKAPKKKKNKKMYFDMDVQDAIIRYNDLDPDKDQSKRNKIYQKEIHYAFDKLCENIINTFKFSYFDYKFEDVKCEVVSFLVMNIHKYDHTKGSKAFSYFSVVAKNYLILHNNNNYKKLKTHSNLDSIEFTSSNKLRVDDSEKDYFNLFINELVKYFEHNIPKIFKKKRDIDIAFSVVELLVRIEEIENFNKKALYLLIREMTGVNTNNITKIINTMKLHYKKVLNEFNTTGIVKINDNSKKFF